MADELLKLYAARKAVPGHAFGTDTHWQEEFEQRLRVRAHAPTRQAAIADIKRDMESPTPMDRLLCGDVGYGKTEVAMRAAFKAVMDGKQVALLAPTTVLAFQHLQHAAAALRRLPGDDRHGQPLPLEAGAEGDRWPASSRASSTSSSARIACCRRTSSSTTSACSSSTRSSGSASPTRSASSRCARKVDVLTMTRDADSAHAEHVAGRHPRHVGDRDAAARPPGDPDQRRRRSTQNVIGDAIRHELERGGQVYFVHNRVESIHSIAGLVQRLVPEARIVVGHGQMGEDELEKVMVDFVAPDVRRAASRRRSSRTASTSRTPTRSSSTAPIATAWRSSISCAAGSAGRIAAPTPTC